MGSYYSHMTLMGTGCVHLCDACGTRVSRDSPAISSSPISLCNGKKCELFVDCFSRFALCIVASLVVSSWAYLFYS